MPPFQKVQNLLYENEFDLHENEPVGGTHFHVNGLTLSTKTRFDIVKRQRFLSQWKVYERGISSAKNGI